MVDKQIFGIVSVILVFVGYLPYIGSIVKGRTRPHIFTWIVGFVSTVIVFAAQVSRGAAEGAWATGVASAICVPIILLSIRRGEKKITLSDWLSFAAALAAIPLWYFTHDPLGAVILATAINVLGCYPTIRKSYVQPHEEAAWAWGVVSVRSLISLAALEQYSLVTMIYPVAISLLTATFVVMLFWRRMVVPRVTK